MNRSTVQELQLQPKCQNECKIKLMYTCELEKFTFLEIKKHEYKYINKKD